MKLLKSFLAAAVTSVLISAPLVSNAAISLKLEDIVNGDSITIIDGGAGDCSLIIGGVCQAVADGSITYIGSIGAWDFNVTTGTGDGIFPGFGLDLNTVSGSTSSGGQLRLSFTETDLTWGAGGPTTFQGSIGGTTAGSVSYGLLADDGNAAFGGATLYSAGTTSGGGSSFFGSSTGVADVSDPFSLTLVVDVLHPSAGLTSFDYEVKIPEPGTLALISLALLGAGVASRRRKA